MCKITLEQVLHDLSITMPFVTTESILFWSKSNFFSSFNLFCLHDNDVSKTCVKCHIFSHLKKCKMCFIGRHHKKKFLKKLLMRYEYVELIFVS